jgi:hypothetical protein
MPASDINKVQGWVVQRFKVQWDGTAPPTGPPFIWIYGDAALANYIGLYYATNGFHVRYQVGGTAIVDSVFAPVSPTYGQELTVAVAWDAGHVKASLNGSSFTSYLLSTNLSNVLLNTTYSMGGSTGIDLEWAAAGIGILTDVDAAALAGTQVLSTTSLPPTAQVQSVYPFKDTVHGQISIYDEIYTSDLDVYLEGLSDPLFQEVQDWSSDTDDDPSKPGYSMLIDPTRSPDEGIPWLAQFVGSTITTGLSAHDQRTQLEGLTAWQRGTVAALQAAPVPYLTGSKTVIIKERDTGPYHFQVTTYANETPNQAAVLAALTAQKPAGLVMNYVVFSGQKAFQVRGSSALRGTPADALRLVV